MDTNNDQYKINFFSFIKPSVLPFVITIFFIIVFIPLMLFTYGTEDQFCSWFVAIGWISFTGLPPIVLHLNYFLNDRNKCIEIDNLKRTITLFVGNEKQIIKYDAIERIEKYCSNTKGGFVLKNNWNTYYYYKIVLKGNSSVYLSRMIIEKIEKKIEGISIKFVRTTYPFIRIKK